MMNGDITLEAPRQCQLDLYGRTSSTVLTLFSPLTRMALSKVHISAKLLLRNKLRVKHTHCCGVCQGAAPTVTLLRLPYINPNPKSVQWSLRNPANKETNKRR